MSNVSKKQKVEHRSNQESTAAQVAKEVSWLLANKKKEITPERFLEVFPNQPMVKDPIDINEAMSKILMLPEKQVRQVYYNLHKDNGKLENPSFLGIHTCVPQLLSAPNIFLNTILRGNGGLLPPYSICMGDKRRVRFGASLFDSGTATIFERAMLSNGKDCGRVEIATGLYKGTPIVLFEHQMGCPAVEIMMRELLSDECMSHKFTLDDHAFVSDAKYIIRIGTCGGINHQTTPSEEMIGMYDIIVTSHQVGVASTDVQAMTGHLNPCDPQYASGARQILEKYGYTIDEHNWPIAEVNKTWSNQLIESARKLVDPECKIHLSGNVSKDSLYAETKEEAFTNMRKEQNVGSTEMEFSTIMKVCREFSIDKGISCRAAMIVVAVGVLPGESFGKSNPDTAHKRTKTAFLTAMEAYHSMSQKHKQARS